MTALKAGVSYGPTAWLTLRAGYNFSTQAVPNDQTFFNILAPAVVQHHLTLGATFAATPRIEVSALYVHAFEKEVKGAGNFNNGDANLHEGSQTYPGTERVEMKDNSSCSASLNSASARKFGWAEDGALRITTLSSACQLDSPVIVFLSSSTKKIDRLDQL